MSGRIPERSEGSQLGNRLVSGGDPSLHSGIRRGGVIAFPTESFYALGADATNPAAIKALFRIKRREAGKPIALVAADVKQVERFFTMSPAERRLAKKHWPGALTVLLRPKTPTPSSSPSGRGRRIAAKALGAKRIGVRVPAHAGARRLCTKMGVPLTATSANISGQPPTKSKTVLRRTFPGILVASGKCGRQDTPSTLIRLDGRRITIIRQGSVHVS